MAPVSYQGQYTQQLGEADVYIYIYISLYFSFILGTSGSGEPWRGYPGAESPPPFLFKLYIRHLRIAGQ